MRLELTAFLVIMALSIDTFISSFSYGVSRTYYPWYNRLIFSLLSALIFVLAVFLSSLIYRLMPKELIGYIGGGILILIGLIKSLDQLIKAIIKKRKMKKTSSLLLIYADPQEADLNRSNSLSLRETLLIAVVLNLDSVLSGLAISIENNSIYLLFLVSLCLNILMLNIGFFIGKKIGRLIKHDLTWLTGVLLIFLGIKSLF